MRKIYASIYIYLYLYIYVRVLVCVYGEGTNSEEFGLDRRPKVWSEEENYRLEDLFWYLGKKEIKEGS